MILVVLRHGKNDGDGLTTEGLAQIQQAFEEQGHLSLVPKMVTDIFHSKCFRSAQTLLGITVTCGLRAHLHEPVPELGNPEWFAEMFPPEVEKLLEQDGRVLVVLRQFHGEANVAEWGQKAAEGIRKIFDRMQGDKAIAVGHMPLIPMASLALGGPYRPLQPLDFTCFQLDGKNITVF